MSGLSEDIGDRLNKAKELRLKKKENSLESPNYVNVRIHFRKEYLINTVLLSSNPTSQFIAEFMTENSVHVYEIYQLVRKQLKLLQNESLQIFFNKKLITNLSTTVKQLRVNNEGPLKLQMTKMQVF